MTSTVSYRDLSQLHLFQAGCTLLKLHLVFIFLAYTRDGRTEVFSFVARIMASPPLQPCSRLRAGVLGATGMVGQRIILLLSNHPWFTIHAVGASSRSAGKRFRDMPWRQTHPMPALVSDMLISECTVDAFKECDVVFSGLDANVAGPIELTFRDEGIPVFSNARNHRMHPEIPLVVPSANPTHLALIEQQRISLKQAGKKENGFIVTNANCSTTGLCVVLAALIQAFGSLDWVQVTTLQAASGAGYPGVSSMDLIDNVVPFISGEEDKLAEEPKKILGSLKHDEHNGIYKLELVKDMKVSASCNRVPVTDGHTLCISVKFRSSSPSMQDIADALQAYTSPAAGYKCPSAPEHELIVLGEEDRPQPRLDRDRGDGFTVSVGRIRPCDIGDAKMVALVHNTVLGAAGSTILNAELCIRMGYLNAKP